jgi:aspartate carbamoyltransferase catalytic subunit
VEMGVAVRMAIIESLIKSQRTKISKVLK